MIHLHGLVLALNIYSGEALTVQKPGTQTRSFCYVSDMVDGLMRLMEGDETGPINIGNPGMPRPFDQYLPLWFVSKS